MLKMIPHLSCLGIFSFFALLPSLYSTETRPDLVENSNPSPIPKAPFQYPSGSTITKLDSTLEIKQYWLYNEWDERSRFSWYIKPKFPNRTLLDPNKKPDKIALAQFIHSIFHEVRGKYVVWKAVKEHGLWKKIVVENLSPDWVRENIKILFPNDNPFAVSDLHGIVLWKESKDENAYELLEGNQRISSWLSSENPQALPATIFIGEPEN
jgi:hypothetical protein